MNRDDKGAENVHALITPYYSMACLWEHLALAVRQPATPWSDAPLSDQDLLCIYDEPGRLLTLSQTSLISRLCRQITNTPFLGTRSFSWDAEDKDLEPQPGN